MVDDQAIVDSFLNNPLCQNYQNSYEGIKNNSLDLYKEVYGLEGEDWENFQSGFMEGLEKGMKSEKGEYDKMFANLDGFGTKFMIRL